jgi:hypothetical protein
MNAFPKALMTSMVACPAAIPVASAAAATTTSGLNRSANPTTTIRIPMSGSKVAGSEEPNETTNDANYASVVPQPSTLTAGSPCQRHVVRRVVIPLGQQSGKT